MLSCLQVDIDNSYSLFKGWQVSTDLQIESTWTEQSFIHGIYSVGGTNDKNIAVFVEAIHLDKKLVNC